MQREPRAFVEDIIISCDAIAADIAGVDVESYLANRMIRSAARGRTIVDFRNQLAHGYMTVNDRLVWGYGVREAPLLREECARLLAEIEGEGAG